MRDQPLSFNKRGHPYCTSRLLSRQGVLKPILW